VTAIDLNGKSPEMSQSQGQGITEQEAPAQLNDEKRRGLENRVRLAVKSMLGNSAKLTKRSVYQGNESRWPSDDKHSSIGDQEEHPA